MNAHKGSLIRLWRPISISAVALLWMACSPDPVANTNNGKDPKANNTTKNNTKNNETPGKSCTDDTTCGAGKCVNNVCTSGQPNNMTGNNNNPMCADPGPCGNCDASCTLSGEGASTGTPFDIENNPAQGVIVDPDGSITLQADTLTPENKVIWIANTAQGTVSKVDTDTYMELARYSTGPLGAGNDPSRTSVNGFGDVYVGNRQGGSVAKIAGQGQKCQDANGDAQVTTSTGSTNVLDWGSDDCVKWHTKLCDGCLIRAVAAQDISPDGDIKPVVWVGGFNNSTIWKLDGETGQILLSTISPVRPYGFALDKTGNLWISGPNWGFGNEGQYVGRVDTKRCLDDASCNVEPCDGEGDADKCVKQRIPVNYQPYGITVDLNQRVWLAGDQILRYDPSQPPGSRQTQVNVNTFNHGIAADEKGFVYAAGYGLGVYKFSAADPTQYQVIAGTPGVENKGLGIDKSGKIWSIARGESVALVIDPGTDVTNSAVVATVQGFVTPYTYSDMTGQQLSLATDVAGYYRRTFEECSPRQDFIKTEWKEVRWDIETPPNASVKIRLRAGTSPEELATAMWDTIAELPPAGGSPFDLEGYLTSKGLTRSRYIEVEVQMTAKREVGVKPNPPILKALSITKNCPRIIN